MIAGFIINLGPKTVLVRAQGPSLVDFGVTGVLDNPSMQLFSGANLIAQNDDWQITDSLCLPPALFCGDDQDIIATGLDPCTAATTGCTLRFSDIYILASWSIYGDCQWCGRKYRSGIGRGV